MIQQLLHVFDGQQMFSIHGDDDGVPYLRDEHLTQGKCDAELKLLTVPTFGLYFISISRVASNLA